MREKKWALKRSSDGSKRARHYPLAPVRAWIGGRVVVAGRPFVSGAFVPVAFGRLPIVLLALVAALVACPAADPPAPALGEAGAASESGSAATARHPGEGPGQGQSADPSTDPNERPGASAPRRQVDERPAIVFLGTSLTAGFGLPESEAYPALIETRLAEAGLDYRVVNAGVSGDTSAGGLRRLDWLLRLPVAVLVVELGANDMLRGQSVEALEANLVAILEKTRATHPDVRFVIEGMRAAPNLGREYGAAFDAVYPRLAERFHAAFVPFLLEDVVTRTGLNQADGIHPTAEGHALIAARVWKTLEPVVREVGVAASR